MFNDEVIRQLVIANPSCADVAAALRIDGTLHMVEPDDLATLACIREGVIIDLGQIISMGQWHADEAFMEYLYSRGEEW